MNEGKGKHYRQNKPYFQGLVRELPTINFNKDDNMSLSIQNAFPKMKTYVKLNYCTNLDNIFHPTSPSYPVIEEAEYNEEFAEEHSKKLAKTMFMTDYKRQKDEEKRLEDDKKKVHGLIEGQLSNASKDQLRTIAAGVDALNNKDSLELIKQIRATHLSVAKAEPKLNFDIAMQSLNSLKMDNNEYLSRYKEKIEAALTRLADAAERAGEEYVNTIPTDEMIVTRFIQSLAPRYGAYVQKINRGERTHPLTLLAAYDDINNHGEEYSNDQRDSSRRNNVFHATITGRGRGRGTGWKPRGGDGKWKSRGDEYNKNEYHNGGNGDRGDEYKRNEYHNSGNGGRGGDRKDRGNASGGRDNGGRDNKNDGPVPGRDGKLLPKVRCVNNKCGKLGHCSYNCPMKDGNNNHEDNINRAVKTAKEDDKKLK